MIEKKGQHGRRRQRQLKSTGSHGCDEGKRQGSINLEAFRHAQPSARRSETENSREQGDVVAGKSTDAQGRSTYFTHSDGTHSVQPTRSASVASTLTQSQEPATAAATPPPLSCSKSQRRARKTPSGSQSNKLLFSASKPSSKSSDDVEWKKTEPVARIGPQTSEGHPTSSQRCKDDAMHAQRSRSRSTTRNGSPPSKRRKAVDLVFTTQQSSATENDQGRSHQAHEEDETQLSQGAPPFDISFNHIKTSTPIDTIHCSSPPSSQKTSISEPYDNSVAKKLPPRRRPKFHMTPETSWSEDVRQDRHSSLQLHSSQLGSELMASTQVVNRCAGRVSERALQLLMGEVEDQIC